MAYVVILHLSPEYDSRLAEILQSVSPHSGPGRLSIEVLVEPDHVYVLPPTRACRWSTATLRFRRLPGSKSDGAPIDIFFRTLAECAGTRARRHRAVGHGRRRIDGDEAGQGTRRRLPGAGPGRSRLRRTCRATRSRPGWSTTSCRCTRCRRSCSAYVPAAGRSCRRSRRADGRAPDEGRCGSIFTLLRARTGHDFSSYKPATMLRRIERRMRVQSDRRRCPTMRTFLRDQPEEPQALLQGSADQRHQLLPRSRRPSTALERAVDPAAVRPARTRTIRCGSGSPAAPPARRPTRSACCWREHAERSPSAPAVQIFATDIDDRGARDGARRALHRRPMRPTSPPERLAALLRRGAAAATGSARSCASWCCSPTTT